MVFQIDVLCVFVSILTSNVTSDQTCLFISFDHIDQRKERQSAFILKFFDIPVWTRVTVSAIT